MARIAAQDLKKAGADTEVEEKSEPQALLI
jgi:hypothetical protein